jgi:formylglycine-generating enzyme required for sulfatase activity
MKLVFIPPGEFEMGSTPAEVNWALDYAQKNKINDKYYLERVPSEAPRHHVKITKPFYLAMYPVTQGEYEKVMGTNSSAFTEKRVEAAAFKPRLRESEAKYRVDNGTKVVGEDTSRHPVKTVNWDEATEFCRRLSTMPAEKAARRVYRLPTEAEWEYACRAGTTTRWYCGDDEVGLQERAWFNKNALRMTHPVGQKCPNAWGLYDMSGNVWQWCSDWFSQDYYKQSPPSDPIGSPAGSSRVVRGGSWYSHSSACRSASRSSHGAAYRSHHVGFRVVVGREAQ